MSQSGPFRTTRSNKIFSPWANGDGGIVALGAPGDFNTELQVERAEKRAKKHAAVVEKRIAEAEKRAAQAAKDGVAAENDAAEALACCIDDDVDTLAHELREDSPGPPAAKHCAPPPRAEPAKRARCGSSPDISGMGPHSAHEVSLPDNDARPGAGPPSRAPLEATGSTLAALPRPSSASSLRENPIAPHSPPAPQPPVAEHTNLSTNRKDRLKQRSKQRSKKHRQERRDKEAKADPPAACKKVALSRLDNAVVINAPVVMADNGASGRAPPSGEIPTISSAPSGFVGRRTAPSKDDTRVFTKAEALGLGFRYIEWDGRTPHVILDAQERVIGVLAGTPRDERWPDAMEKACAALDEARCALGAEREEKKHRRGKFSVIASGISYGGGQKEPCNRDLSPGEKKVVDELRADPAIQRIAGFGDGAFRLFCPKLHRSYEENLKALMNWKPTLKPNFENSVFGSVTFNLGPRTQTFRHTDFQNRATGMCAITALGTFDHTQSGHIILWELGMIIEFPSSSTILIPSALVKHSNTAVQPHERRYSMTQYSAGGLFRWVECGFRTEKAFLASGGRYEQTGAERWHRGLDLFSSWSDLRDGSARD